MKLVNLRKSLAAGNQGIRYILLSLTTRIWDYALAGFTILEIIIVIAIIGVIIGTITPMTFHIIKSQKESSTKEDLQALKRAIVGSAFSSLPTEKVIFGYTGDVGNLPQKLEDLYFQPDVIPYFSFNSTIGIGYGWRGPYISKKGYTSVTDFLKDPYGRPYLYSTTPTTDTTLGAEVLGFIRSLGQDGINNTDDDLTVEILENELLADVTGKIKDAKGVGVPTVPVTINYPTDGSLNSLTTHTDLEGRYRFSRIPLGERAITVQPALVFLQGTAFARSGPLPMVEFSVANLSSDNIGMSSITVYCATSPDTYYGRVRIKDLSGAILRDVTLHPRLSTETEDPVGFTTLTIAGSARQGESCRVWIQPPGVEVPEIELNTAGAGGTLTIELQDFSDAAIGGSPASLVGVPFRVTFSNGSHILFVPQKQ